jgi:hypothetical protein
LQTLEPDKTVGFFQQTLLIGSIPINAATHWRFVNGNKTGSLIIH